MTDDEILTRVAEAAARVVKESGRAWEVIKVRLGSEERVVVITVDDDIKQAEPDRFALLELE